MQGASGSSSKRDLPTEQNGQIGVQMEMLAR